MENEFLDLSEKKTEINSTRVSASEHRLKCSSFFDNKSVVFILICFGSFRNIS